VHSFAPALAELTTRVWDTGNAHFEPTSFQISNINAGTGAPNVIPGELKARFNLRYNPVQTQEGLRRTVEEILDRHGVRYTIEWYVSGEPFYTPPGPLSDAVKAAVLKTAGITPTLSTGGGTSDGRFIATLGTKVVELGVTNASIHKVNECVAVAEIEALHALYVEVLKQLLT
jgi:succinyl-diaminopimelate desuccinylase